MDTQISIYNRPGNVDLKDISSMVDDYVLEVEKLEERVKELESENGELKGRLKGK